MSTEEREELIRGRKYRGRQLEVQPDPALKPQAQPREPVVKDCKRREVLLNMLIVAQSEGRAGILLDRDTTNQMVQALHFTNRQCSTSPHAQLEIFLNAEEQRNGLVRERRLDGMWILAYTPLERVPVSKCVVAPPPSVRAPARLSAAAGVLVAVEIPGQRLEGLAAPVELVSSAHVAADAVADRAETRLRLKVAQEHATDCSLPQRARDYWGRRANHLIGLIDDDQGVVV